MKCEEALDLIVDQLMDGLDDAQQAKLDAHLADCETCAADSVRLRGVWEDLMKLDAPVPSPAAGLRLGASIKSAETKLRRTSQVFQIAAALTLFAAGGVGGYALRGIPAAGPAVAPNATDSEQFLLLVRGEEPLTDLSGPDIVREYRDWAASLADKGLLVGANKLRDEPGRWISGLPQGDERVRSDVSGYFLLNASSYNEAEQIARASPHIRFGGTFEIRQLDERPEPWTHL